MKKMVVRLDPFDVITLMRYAYSAALDSHSALNEALKADPSNKDLREARDRSAEMMNLATAMRAKALNHIKEN